jgi:two-component system, NarL family, nitrate/nitrite response regulator NarL
MPERIRVLAADDHPLYRASVVRAIREHPQLELVGEAADGREALALIREHRPHVALVDLRMPSLDGNGVIDALLAERSETRVLLLSGDLESGAVYTAVERGAAGVLSKLTGAQELMDAVMAVARGETVIAAEAQGAIASEIRLRSQDDRPVLTDREREILVRMAEGDSIPDTARQLHLSVSTVKTHVEHLYRKLGVSDRAAAVASAMRRGILD